jgi:L-ascorbate metabolism protein UlaG (beta-lactamase superfamily)
VASLYQFSRCLARQRTAHYCAAPPAQVNDGCARVTFVGHATVLIQVAGLNILTDPVWSERASPISFAGPKRVTPPAIVLDVMPRIDVILISHDHFDHLDTEMLRKLDARDKPRVIVPLGNLALVQQTMPASFVSEHDWAEKVQISKASSLATIHVEPMLHGSGRTPFDQMQTLWAAFVIEAAGLKIYHVGDTGYGDGKNFRDAGYKHGGFDLAILPIGAYEPASFRKDSHMRPSDAVKALQDTQAKGGMAHHFEAFQLGFESFDAPRQELIAALEGRKLPAERFAIPKPGQAVVIPAFK